MDSILSSAALLLERDGIEGLTTNNVARLAGVSVGSLYQYFPDKAAIVGELARRIQFTAIELAVQESVRLQSASTREVIARVTRLSCSPHFGTNAMRRALLREVPRGWTLRETRATDTLIQNMVAAIYAARPDQHRSIAPRAVFPQQQAVIAVAEAILFTDPDAFFARSVQDELFYLGWSFIAREGDPLDVPAVADDDLPPLHAEDEATLARRLLRKVASEEKRSSSRPPRARGVETRQALIAAAERVLTAEGFEGLSARALAVEAGLAVGALYHHFSSVAAVVAALAEQHELRTCDALERALDQATTRDESVDALVAVYTDEALAPSAPRRVLLAQVPRRWTEATTLELQSATVRRLARSLSAAEATRRQSFVLMAFFALHAVKGVIEAFTLLEPDLAIDDLREDLRELITRYLREPPARSAA